MVLATPLAPGHVPVRRAGRALALCSEPAPLDAQKDALRDHYLRHKDDPRPGYAILLAGGAIHDDAIYEAGRLATERARTNKPRLAVIMSSYASLADAERAFEGDLKPYFSGLGFDPVHIPVAIDQISAASSQRWVDEVNRADAVYLAGGDQSRHTKSLLDAHGQDSPLAAALRKFGSGNVIMGSSAGTATQGVLQYGEGDIYKYLSENRVAGSIGPGLDLAGHLAWIFCTHFDQRNRLGRLLVALKEAQSILSPEERRAKGPHQLAVGVDEDTALLVRGDVGTVHGKNGVFIVDASDAEWGCGPQFSAQNIKLHYLRDGDSFDFSTRTVRSEERAQKPVGSKTAYRSRDLLAKGGEEITKMIQTLVSSQSSATQGDMHGKRGEPIFRFTLKKTPDTERFGRREVSASSLRLDVSTAGA